MVHVPCDGEAATTSQSEGKINFVPLSLGNENERALGDSSALAP